jgi:cell division inhibitor SepF
MESGIVRKAMVYLGIADEDSPDLDVVDDPAEPVCVDKGQVAARMVDPSSTEPPPSRSRQPGTASSGPSGSDRSLRPIPSARVHVVTPISFGDAQEIADHFRADQPVVVNLQNVDGELTRRLIDFCSGAAYALDGSMEKIAHQVLLLTPPDVEISADERRRWQARPVRA